jgi:hypothetical protein
LSRRRSLILGDAPLRGQADRAAPERRWHPRWTGEAFGPSEQPVAQSLALHVGRQVPVLACEGGEHRAKAQF